MNIFESLHHDLVTIVSPNLIKELLEKMLERKEADISSLRDKILKYEQKRRAEDAFYQSLSPLRKLFTGHAPSHHRAVEYMVNVKDRMKKVESLKIQVAELKTLLEALNEPEASELTLSHSILDELRPYLMTGDIDQ